MNMHRVVEILGSKSKSQCYALANASTMLSEAATEALENWEGYRATLNGKRNRRASEAIQWGIHDDD